MISSGFAEGEGRASKGTVPSVRLERLGVSDSGSAAGRYSAGISLSLSLSVSLAVCMCMCTSIYRLYLYVLECVKPVKQSLLRKYGL